MLPVLAWTSSTLRWDMNSKNRWTFGIALGLILTSLALNGKTLERVDDALQRLFPGAKTERLTAYLSKEEQESAGKLLGEPLNQSLVTYYRVTTTDGEMAYAYLDAHRVRTLPETLLISVDSSGALKSVDVLVFREPEDYIPRKVWYDQFRNRKFSKDLRLHRDIHGISGATLTGRATVNSSRKVLCIHQVLMERTNVAEAPK